MKSYLKKHRRGVAMLVVLSLLVLFVMLGVAYSIATSHYRAGAAARAKKTTYGVRPEKQLDRAMRQLLRGPGANNPSSSLQQHSLLRDMYGGQGLLGRTTNVAISPGVGGQFLDVFIDPQVVSTTDGAFFSLVNAASAFPRQAKPHGFFNGCLMTFVSGPARNTTARIVGYESGVNGGNPFAHFRVMVLDEDQSVAANLGSFQQQNIVINGRPFSGMGIGHYRSEPPANITDALNAQNLPGPQFSTPGKLDGRMPHMLGRVDGSGNPIPDQIPPLLTPNYAYMMRHLTSALTAPGANRSTYGPILNQGGANESYDAPGLSDMFLAYVSPGATDSAHILPSFHRPELIHYWRTQHRDIWTNREMRNNLLRTIMMRPSQADHPNFDGSNPQFSLRAMTVDADGDSMPDSGVFAWDVDNDGDGVPDSIWVDLGFPVQTDEDGRRYKPLFAFLCLDLDGRINLNAAGNPFRLYGNSPEAAALANNMDSSTLPLGQGLGPAEINLLSFLNNDANQMREMLHQRYGSGQGVNRATVQPSPGSTGVDPSTIARE